MYEHKHVSNRQNGSDTISAAMMLTTAAFNGLYHGVQTRYGTLDNGEQ
jgi:hypothetical protein